MSMLAFVRAFALLPLLVAPVLGSEAELRKFVVEGEPAVTFDGEVAWTTAVDTGGELTLTGVVAIEDQFRATIRFEGKESLRPFGRRVSISIRTWDGQKLAGYGLAGVGMGLGDELGTRIQGVWARVGSNGFVYDFLGQSNVGYLRFSNWLYVYLVSPEGLSSTLAVRVDDTVRAAVVALGI